MQAYEATLKIMPLCLPWRTECTGELLTCLAARILRCCRNAWISGEKTRIAFRVHIFEIDGSDARWKVYDASLG
jgi:hypothetical protein